MTGDPADDSDADLVRRPVDRPDSRRLAPLAGAAASATAANPVLVQGGAIPRTAGTPLVSATTAAPRTVAPEPARASTMVAEVTRGRRRAARADGAGGRVASDRPWRGGRDLALVATVRTAAPRLGRTRARSPLVRAAELRERVRVTRRGRLLVLVVDVSGSMGADLLLLARRAVGHLLRAAHRMRDRVAVVAFRGRTATALVPPTRSILLAERRLAGLETGGTTPLSAGLATGLDVVKLAERRDRAAQSVLLVLSDGHANVGTRPGHRAVLAELARVCASLRAQRAVRCVLFDATEEGKDGRDARRLAEMLGARRVEVASLRHLDDPALARVLADV